MVVLADHVKKLREQTGAGMMDCKKALQETGGDFNKAIEFLRKKGIADAGKKIGRVAAEGVVYAYIHGEGRLGVLVEINSETDFVARNSKFQDFVKNIAMHVAAANPLYISEEDVPAAILEKEIEIYKHQANASHKPQKVVEKIADGKLQKYLDEVCLLRQPYIRDTDKTISDLLKELIASVGENCRIRRFVRFQLGEGIEKRQESLQEHVQT